VAARPLLDKLGEWRAFLAAGLGEEALETLRRHERSGPPLGSAAFVERLEAALGRALKTRKPGPKPAAA
jgi:putative transposase